MAIASTGYMVTGTCHCQELPAVDVDYDMFRGKRPYTQVEVAEQIGVIAKLQEQRAKAETARKQEEYVRANSAIEVAQHILQYMLEEIEQYLKVRKK